MFITAIETQDSSSFSDLVLPILTEKPRYTCLYIFNIHIIHNLHTLHVRLDGSDGSAVKRELFVLAEDLGSIPSIRKATHTCL